MIPYIKAIITVSVLPVAIHHNNRQSRPRTFGRELVADDYLEAPDCSVAIAAAEVVAALMGNPNEDFPEEIEVWVEEQSAPSATRIAQARQAIQAILIDSELKGLWQDSGGLEKWRETIEDLLSRLSC